MTDADTDPLEDLSRLLRDFVGSDVQDPRARHPSRLAGRGRVVTMTESFLKQLADYWRQLSDMPELPRDGVRGPKVREYGHPGETQSDTASEIAKVFVTLAGKVADAASEPRTAVKHVPTIVDFIRERRDLVPMIFLTDDALLNSMLALHDSAGAALGAISLQADAGTCPRCGDRLWISSGGDEAHCECGHCIHRDHLEILGRARMDAYIAEQADEPVPVTIKYAATFYKVPYKKIEKLLERNKIKRLGKDEHGRVLLDKRELDPILGAPPTG